MRTRPALLVLLLAAAVCGALHAQDPGKHGKRLLDRCRALVAADVAGRRSWLLGRLRELGLQPALEEFVQRGTRGTNLVARLGPARKPPLLLVAHLDRLRTSPGANDMAAGCVVLLETAAWLRARKPAPQPVQLLFVDAAKPRHLGSLAWIERHDGEELQGVLDVDLVGCGDSVILGPSSTLGDASLLERTAARAREASWPLSVFARMPASEGRPFAASGVDVVTLGMLPAEEVEPSRSWLASRGRKGAPSATVARVNSNRDRVDALSAAALERSCALVRSVLTSLASHPLPARRVRKDLVRDLRRFRHLLRDAARWKALLPEERADMLQRLGPRATLRCLLVQLEKGGERTLPAASLILRQHITSGVLRRPLQGPLEQGDPASLHAALAGLYRTHHASLTWNRETAAIGVAPPPASSSGRN